MFQSCSRETSGTVVFWKNETTADFLVDSKVTVLYLFVDGKYVGSQEAETFFKSIPDCGDESAFTVTKDLEGESSAIFTFWVENQGRTKLFDGTIEFFDDACTPYQL